jgi:hypothetical protein
MRWIFKENEVYWVWNFVDICWPVSWFAVDTTPNFTCFMVLYNSRPLRAVNREPQCWHFALQSPPTRNLFPNTTPNFICFMVLYKSRPLRAVNREPQCWHFALQSPPTRNLFPSELINCFFLITCLRGSRWLR